MKTRHKKSWRWLPPSQREARNEHIAELYALGYSYAEIAEQVDLTKQRVGQIVKAQVKP